jgi:hypothetical protein
MDLKTTQKACTVLCLRMQLFPGTPETVQLPIGCSWLKLELTSGTQRAQLVPPCSSYIWKVNRENESRHLSLRTGRSILR